ncbi:MAG: carbamoyl phosphate synthetase [Bacteroidetes bacterium 43-16]|nr:MAG: carbamoyl phosphate synthetase [Bacteroidetes bacterium 43-16]
MESKKLVKAFSRSGVRFSLLVTVMVMATVLTYAQSGEAGIQAANTEVRRYFGVGTQLMYGVGAILGLIGAVKVYSKWNQGDQDTSKVAASWFGSCIFLVVVATVIRGFFGVS